MTEETRTAIARFVNVRAPQAISDAGQRRIRQIHAPEGFASQMIKAIKDKNIEWRDQQRDLAARLIKKIDDDLFSMPLEDAVRQALMPRAVNASAASNSMKAELGKTPKQLVSNSEYRKRWHMTWERYYCQCILGQDRRDTANILRAAAVIENLADLQGSDKAGTWSDALTWRLVVPKHLFLPIKPKDAPRDPMVKEMLGKVKELQKELDLLAGLQRKVELEDRRYYKFGAGSKVKMEYSLDREIHAERPRLIQPLRADTPALPDLPSREEISIRLRDGKGNVATEAGDQMIEPANWLREQVAAPVEKSVFNKTEQDYLKRYEAVTLRENERNAMETIRADHYKRTRDLLFDPKHALPVAVAEAPETKALMKSVSMPAHKSKVQGGKAFKALESTLPRVHVLGVGDLIVVEEQINRYEMGEVAHIENVMAKESRSRTHLRIAETETTLTSESEETATDEKSLQTTDRFELSKETQSQLETSLEVTAGASVSAGYGPVSVSANTGLTSSTSASSGRSTASTLAREAVEKAVSTVTNRVREEQIIRVLNRIEETNEHGFENDTDQNLCGIYRWVDKYYTVRAVNYGRRLMLEMIVPEPANGFLYAQDMHADEDIIAPPPPAITFGPEDVTRYNYLDYAETYSAVDIPSPPPSIIYQTLTYGAVGDGGMKKFAETGKTIAIPEGYKTTNVYRNSRVIFYDDYISEHTAGSKRFPSDNSTLDGVTGSLQLSSLVSAAAFHVGWKVRCELMDGAYEAWQVQAWAAIKQAYDAAVSAYEEKLAAHAIGQGVHIEGRNPDENGMIIAGELKRAAIRYLSEDMGELVVAGNMRSNEVFDAADDTGDFDLEEARIEGMIIQFFEQAFEWHNMTWLFYPYFWAKSSRQHEKLLAEDPDPKMREFLSAGAARVVVPVPVDYEDAVLNFFETNEIWNGGEPPMVDDAEYVSIAEELKQGRTNSFNSPIYYESAGTPPPYIVDEWEVKLPTSLVKLQADGTLPSFPAGLYETDAAKLLDAKVLSSGSGANWRSSIVDLLTLFNVANANDEAQRRSFASSVGYSGDPDADPIASVDSWCYFYVLSEINLNGID